MRIAICTPYLNSHDAVSNDVIAMYHALRGRGYEADIFVTDSFVTWPEARKLESIEAFISNSEDVLIYHHSVGWDAGVIFLQKLDCRKVVRYHNVTPAKFFDGLSEDHANACEAGRKQLEIIRDLNISIYLSASEYNAEEIYEKKSGEISCVVLPPFHQIDRLEALEADREILNSLQDGKTNLLMVGRVTPNKGHCALVDVFNIYHREYNQNSRLLIVGKEDYGALRSYTISLRSKIGDFNLDESVLFLGEVSDMALKSCYLAADVFVITSDHEGFCVPLVEAMSMRVPIVAYGSTGIPGTVGNAGLVWDECDPNLLAGSVDRVVRDEHVRLALGDMGFRRYKSSFSNAKIQNCFFEALAPLIS